MNTEMSWASFGRHLKWNETHYHREGRGRLSKFLAQILIVNVDSFGADPIGEVLPGGSITLLANTWLVRYELVPNVCEYGAYPMNCHILRTEPAVLDTVGLRVEKLPLLSQGRKTLAY
jgi:hypothetical protein